MRKFFLATILFPLSLCGTVVDSTLIYHCHFDSAADVQNPAIGFPGEIEGEIEFVEGIRGKSARIPVHGKGIVNVRLPNGMPIEKGKVEFYAKLEAKLPTYESRGNPTFLHVSNAEGKGEIHNIGITSNNGNGRSGFLVNLGGQVFTMFDGCAYRMPYSGVYGDDDPNAWHRYSYVWNTNGLDGASSDMFRAYIDDRMVLHGSLTAKTLERYAERVSQPALMSLPRSPLDKGNNHVAFCVDELKIWSTDNPQEENIELASAKPARQKRIARLSDSPELAERKRREKEAAEAEAKRAAEAAKTLSDWACGPFVGGSDDSSVEFTVESNGRLRGTYKTIEKTWSLSAESFVKNDLTNNVCEIAVEYSCGEAKSVKPLVITPLSARAEGFEAWMCEWNTNPAWIGVAKRLEGQQSKIVEDDAIIRLDVTTNALVEVMLATDKHVFETRTTLVPSPDSASEFRAFICVPRDAEKAFDGFAGEITIEGE